MAKGIKEAIQSLKEAVGDLSSLEVQTLTGELIADTAAGDAPASGGSVINWREAIKSARSTGKVRLVAATLINFDGDSTHFVAEGDVPPQLLQAHQAAIESGLRIRADLLQLAKDTVGSLL